MRYLSVCSGIEACSVAWEPLGWQCAGLSEIEAFPRAVLQHRYGTVPVDFDHRHTPQSNVLPLFGDFTQIEEHHVGPIDLLVGGTPCQAFSVAGKRLGLDDPRGNLTLEFLALARRLRPRWLLWENVPGVLSDDSGRTMGTFLGLVGQLGYRGCYRVLDAQFVRVDGFGRAVPQRRRRVFFVGHLGDDGRAFPVLFEPESLRGHPAPRRQAGESVAPTIAARVNGGGGLGTDFDCDGGPIVSEHPYSGTVSSKWAKGAGGPAGDELQNLVAHALRADGFDASEDGTGRGTPIVLAAFPEFLSATQCASAENLSPSLCSINPTAVAFDMRGREGGSQFEGPHYTANIRAASGGSSRSYLADQWAVRRLTPKECERLMGFPDGWTDVPYRGKQAADGPRYRAIGNSMAVNVMRWVGLRMQWADSVHSLGQTEQNQDQPACKQSLLVSGEPKRVRRGS